MEIRNLFSTNNICLKNFLRNSFGEMIKHASESRMKIWFVKLHRRNIDSRYFSFEIFLTRYLAVPLQPQLQRFNLLLIRFTNPAGGYTVVALRRTLANDLHRRVFWSHHVRHRVVNTYFRLARTRSTEFYLAAVDRNEIPQRCAPTKIPFRGPRLAGAWLNWRSVAGIRSSLQRIEFLSQLSTRPSYPRAPTYTYVQTRTRREFHGNRLNAAAAFNGKGNEGG